MRLSIFIFALISLAPASGQNPPPKKEHLEKRANILRQMAEMKAKLSALELELQLLEESRTAEPAQPPALAWREENGTGEGAAKKTLIRCLSVTRDGKRCSRPAEAGGRYCWQHRLH